MDREDHGDSPRVLDYGLQNKGRSFKLGGRNTTVTWLIIAIILGVIILFWQVIL